MIVVGYDTRPLGSRVTLRPDRKAQHISRSTLRSVVVPTEHGGWGFTLEPVLFGLLVAPGWPAAGLGIATFATFLARRPLRLAVADVRRRRRLERTGVAMASVIVLGMLSLGGLALAVVTADSAFWWPLIVAAPMVAVQLRFDLGARGRELLPELLGPVALAAAAPMMILAAGIGDGPAAGAWVVLTARIIPSVLLVRAQLLRAKQQTFSQVPTHVAGVLAAAAVVAAAAAGWAPRLSIAAAMGVAVWDAVSLARPPVAARTVGWTQMLVGLVVVAAFAAGRHAGW